MERGFGGGQPAGLAAASAWGRRPPSAGGGPTKYHQLAFRNSLHRTGITRCKSRSLAPQKAIPQKYLEGVCVPLPCWGISSDGRASALQAEGQRFESAILHSPRSFQQEASIRIEEGPLSTSPFIFPCLPKGQSYWGKRVATDKAQ
jgi:hypothetical protein